MKNWIYATLALVLTTASDLLADEYLQQYIRPSDMKVLYEFKGDQETVKIMEKGDLRETLQGVKYHEVMYRAWTIKNNREKEKVNEQLVWMFGNEPRGGDDTRSNRWIYWCKPLSDGRGKIWGRCPTPLHPNYAQWRSDKGADLWQIVPMDQRANVPNDADADTAVSLMAVNRNGTPKIIGEMDNDMPRIVPRDREPRADTITCVRFEHFI